LDVISLSLSAHSFKCNTVASEGRGGGWGGVLRI
jgi:hypothetical protein